MRKRNTIMMSAILLAVVNITSCSSDMEDGGKISAEKGEINLSESTRTTAGELRGFYVHFTADMARHACRTSTGRVQNVVVSPLSAAMLFSMVANGLDGEQKQSYTDYLGVGDLNSLNQLCSTLIGRLPESDRTARFMLSNSLWVNKSFDLSLTDATHSLLSEKYRADIRYADFLNENSKSLQMINDWCASSTNHLIPACLDILNPGDLALTLNTIYFKAPWSGEIFDAARTDDGIFHGLDSDTGVRMMESDFFDGWYSRAGGFEYFSMDFGNGAFSLNILLPGEDKPMDESIGELTPGRLASIRGNGSFRPLKVYLPKISVEGKYNLNGMLDAIGSSDLTNNLTLTMFTAPQTGNIIYNHAATFSVDEVGAELSAETTGEFYNTALPSYEAEPLILKVDRPFFFFIEEFSTGACILSGCITNL